MVGFVFAVDVALRVIVFKITHFCYAIVPFAAASKDPAAVIRNPGRLFPVGHSVKIVIGRYRLVRHFGHFFCPLEANVFNRDISGKP